MSETKSLQLTQNIGPQKNTKVQKNTGAEKKEKKSMPSKRRSGPPPTVLTDGSQVFECKYCFQKFPAYMSLVAHLRKHKEVKSEKKKDDNTIDDEKQEETNSTQCLGCGKKFAYKGPYYNHINTCAKNKKRLEKVAQEKEQKRIEHSKLPPSLQPRSVEKVEEKVVEKKNELPRPIPKSDPNMIKETKSVKFQENSSKIEKPFVEKPLVEKPFVVEKPFEKPFVERMERIPKQQSSSFEKAMYKTDVKRPLFLPPPPKSIVYLPVHDNQWAPYQSIQKKIYQYVAQLDASTS